MHRTPGFGSFLKPNWPNAPQPPGYVLDLPRYGALLATRHPKHRGETLHDPNWLKLLHGSKLECKIISGLGYPQNPPNGGQSHTLHRVGAGFGVSSQGWLQWTYQDNAIILGILLFWLMAVPPPSPRKWPIQISSVTCECI